MHFERLSRHTHSHLRATIDQLNFEGEGLAITTDTDASGQSGRRLMDYAT